MTDRSAQFLHRPLVRELARGYATVATENGHHRKAFDVSWALGGPKRIFRKAGYVSWPRVAVHQPDHPIRRLSANAVGGERHPKDATGASRNNLFAAIGVRCGLLSSFRSNRIS